MGLYLCIFDELDEELEGVEVGFYADFGDFRDTIVAVVEKGVAGAVCPTLNNHSDCDGEWSSSESALLIRELDEVAAVLQLYPSRPLETGWKTQVAHTLGLNLVTLADCFFDVDGEPLIQRLRRLAQVSVDSGHPIVFQ